MVHSLREWSAVTLGANGPYLGKVRNEADSLIQPRRAKQYISFTAVDATAKRAANLYMVGREPRRVQAQVRWNREVGASSLDGLSPH